MRSRKAVSSSPSQSIGPIKPQALHSRNIDGNDRRPSSAHHDGRTCDWAVVFEQDRSPSATRASQHHPVGSRSPVSHEVGLFRADKIWALPFGLQRRAFMTSGGRRGRAPELSRSSAEHRCRPDVPRTHGRSGCGCKNMPPIGQGRFQNWSPSRHSRRAHRRTGSSGSRHND